MDSSAPADGASTATSLPASEPEAEAAVANGVKELRAANSGQYIYFAEFDGIANITEKGSFSYEPLQYDFTRTMNDGQELLELHYIGVGADAWVRATSPTSEADSWPCWVRLSDVAEVGELDGFIDVGQAGGLPAAVEVFSSAIGRQPQARAQKGNFEGSVDLSRMLGLFAPALREAAGIEPDASHSVPARLELHNDTLVAYVVRTGDLLDEVEAAGGDAQDQIVLDALDSRINKTGAVISDLGSPVNVTPPPSDAVADLSGTGDLQPAFSTCAGAEPPG